jgi:hypothetical protein
MRRIQQHAVVVAVVALGCASMPASGQRGMRGGAESSQGGGESAEVARVDLPIVGLLLEHPDEFKLTDAQRSALESVGYAQDSANRPGLLTLDSLRVEDVLTPEQQQHAAALEDETRKRLDESTRGMRGAVDGSDRVGRGRSPED